MVRKVRFRASAEADLFALYDYIATVAGREIAGSSSGASRPRASSLRRSPNGEPTGRSLAPALRTIGFERRVTIAFRVLSNAVEIVAIAYAGRDFTAEVCEEEPRSEYED